MKYTNKRKLAEKINSFYVTECDRFKQIIDKGMQERLEETQVALSSRSLAKFVVTFYYNNYKESLDNRLDDMLKEIPYYFIIMSSEKNAKLYRRQRQYRLTK